ncbi:MAG: 6-bladed beta-propeller [Bacteroidetes bacterium]|nr:6-bladed beta-propeller [Bacteroidota bacterium]
MNRRQFTQRSAQVAALTFFPVNIISKMSQADEIIGHGDYQYRVHKDWGQQDPSLVPVNNCHEMVQDRQGRLLMIGDDIRNNILIYNTDGKIIDTWGSEYPFGHGLTLWDEGGEDVLFICDNGFDGNPQVVKTTLTGDVIMRLNHPHELGIYDQSDPYHPTETAVAPNGDIYVADGYGSQWILQFNYRGEYIRKFGGQGDADHQFQTAHGVCVDLRNPDIPSLVCTSRGHNAFKKFTLDGEYLSTIFLPGAYVCRAVIHNQMLYSGVCWSRLRYLNQTPDSGFVTILDETDRVVSNPGGTAPEYENGELQLMLQQEKIFNHCHDVCVDKDENLYVCQWNAGKTYPIKLERV